MIGDSGVGKQDLVNRFVSNGKEAPANFLTSIGIAFDSKKVWIDDKIVKINIADTAGQERFRTITTSYFRGVQGIFLVYDVTDRRSFESIRNWISQVRQHANANVKMTLVGNNCDKTDERTVSTAEGQALADETDMVGYFEVSAKNDLMVEQAFIDLATALKASLEEKRESSAYAAPFTPFKPQRPAEATCALQ